MMNIAFEKRLPVASLCLILLLALSLFATFYPSPAYSRSSPGLHQGLGYKPHPQDRGYREMIVGKSQSQTALVGDLTFDAASEKEFTPWRFPGLIPVLSFGLTLGFLTILRTGTLHRREDL